MFDFDGTLADTFPLFERTFDQVADRFGFRRRNPADAETMRRLDARAIMRHHGVSAWKLPFIARHARALMARHIAELTLFSGIAPALATLADNGVALALVTSNTRANATAVLGPQLIARFSHLACGISVFGKAAKLRRLARRQGRPDDVLFVGDELRDADAASAAGIAFGAVAWGYTRLDALLSRQPREIFHQPSELVRLATKADSATASPPAG
jgi:phosphoglycolate phosphatase